MVILRDLGYGKNRLQEIIVEEVEELCKIVTSKEGEVMDICELLKYVKFPTFLLIKVLGIVTSPIDNFVHTEISKTNILALNSWNKTTHRGS